MTRDEIRDILSKRVAEVTFTKKDGSERVMLCTLAKEFLPDLVGSNTKRNTSVLPVWDLEKDAWRSFRVDSVISVEEL